MSQSKDSQILKKTYMALKKSQQRLDELEHARHEPLAVIGMACRFPGGANTPDKLWQLLKQGGDASCEIPEQRWKSDIYYNPDPATPGTTHANRANILTEPIDEFDAPFFNISAKEARAMDPQQRLLLEVAWEAMEHAGLNVSELSGSKTGVYVGISSDDYSLAHRHSGDYNQVDAYSLTGTCFAPAAGRISYTFGFEGPCLALDTACSSSLVALHLACQALRNREMDMALVGGVNLILTPSYHICSTKLGTISPDGRCKTFDAAADGYGRGEGCGVVAVKRLADALRDRDPIQAVIRGAAVNQDGKSNGLTAPNGLSQDKVIRSALHDATLTPADIDYMEAHGTGTPLGDPIEVESIARVMGEAHTQENPVLIGSVKINIGHLEAAAGVSGLFKVILAMQNQALPPHFQFKNPNQYVPWDQLPVKVPTELTPWQKNDAPLRAGISSFGFSGTNAHVIVEQAPPMESATHEQPPTQDRDYHILPLSAKSEQAVKKIADKYSQSLKQGDEALSDICHTAAVGRSHFNHRLAVVAPTKEDLQEKLQTFTQGKTPPGFLQGHGTSAKPKIAFAFTGQGSQYVGMGKELYESSPVFREAMDACDRGLQPHLNESLLSLLYRDGADEARLTQTQFTQPAIFALEYALARLWLSWGVKPDMVMGHSIGEYAAACMAGILTLQDALCLVAARGRLMQSLPENGSMAAVFAGEEDVLPYLSSAGNQLSLAAVNAPGSVVISGERDALRGILERLNQDDISSKELNVSHAFHSPLMEPILNEFQQTASGITYHPPQCSVISTVSGQFMKAGELASADYWAQQIRRPVRFCDALETLSSEQPTILLEIGAMPILSGLAKRTLSNEQGAILYSMKKGEANWKSMLQALGEIYIQGIPVDWKPYDAPYPRKRVALPTYAFQRKQFYLNPVRENHVQDQGRASGGETHPYLGGRIDTPLLQDDTSLFQAYFTAAWPGFLQQHKIFGKMISPGAAHISTAISAWRNEHGNQPCVLEHVDMTQPLVIEEEGSRVVQAILENRSNGKADFRLMSKDDMDRNAAWITHCNGQVRGMADTENEIEPLPMQEIQSRCRERMTTQELYSYIESLGYSVGPLFQCVRDIYQGNDESLCVVKNVNDVDEMAIYPGLVDSFLQTVLPALKQNERSMLDGEHVLIPLHFKKIQVQKGLNGDLYCHTRVNLMDEAIQCQIRVADANGNVVLEIEDFLLKYTDRNTLYRELSEDWQSMVYLTQWEELTQPEETDQAKETPSYYLVLDDKHGLGLPLMQAFHSRNAKCIRAIPGDRYEQAANDEFVIRQDNQDDLSKVIQDILGQERTGPLQIVYCRGAVNHTRKGRVAKTVEQAEQDIVQGLLTLIQTLQTQNSTDQVKIWLITQSTQPVYSQNPSIDPIPSPLWGLGRTLAMEFPEMWGGLVDVDLNLTEKAYTVLANHIASQSLDNQIALTQNGRLHGARFTPAKKKRREGEPGTLPIPKCASQEGFFLDTGNKGTLDELNFKKRPRRDPQAEEVEVHVHASGLNFRDVLNVLGQYPGDAGHMGYEATGIVTKTGSQVTSFQPGDRVIVMDAPGCICDYITCGLNSVLKIPAGMNFYEAVTLPATFLTAYHALVKLGRLQAGDKVLIHAGAGGVGMAAVQLSLNAGAEVFATAGSAEKRHLLKEMGVHHVMNSRTLDFAEEIRSLTQGKGVDVVLNSLSGDFIEKSFSVLAPNGRFLEMGKIGIWDREQVRAQDPTYAYHPFDLSSVSRENPGYIVELFNELAPKFESNQLQPLPYAVFPMRRAKDAFRYMAQAKHVGKIVLSRMDAIRREERETHGLIRADATYLITGGLGALGLRTAQWLVEEGAKHIVLTGRSQPKPESRAVMQALTEQGAEIAVMQGDVAREEDVTRILQQIREEMPPLKGILHAAGVLQDGMLADQTWERFQTVMAPKAWGAWNLHRNTQTDSLDFFVMFSSVASVLGNLGQSNYAAANAFMDSLAHARRKECLPALSINWGPWADAGMAAGVSKERFASQGITNIEPGRGMQILNTLLAQEFTQPCVIEVDWRKYAESRDINVVRDFFSPVIGQTQTRLEEAVAKEEQTSILNELQEYPPAQHETLLLTFLKQTALDVLGYSESEPIEADEALVNQGFDSLMSVEMRNRLGKSLNQTLPASLLFDYPTLNKIAAYLLENIVVIHDEESATHESTVNESPPDELLNEIDDLVKS